LDFSVISFDTVLIKVMLTRTTGIVHPFPIFRDVPRQHPIKLAVTTKFKSGFKLGSRYSVYLRLLKQ